MTITTDHTHDKALQSWVKSANAADADFPIQNLPFGVFRRKRTANDPRIGVAIGDHVLDVKGAVEHNLLGELQPKTACALYATSLNDFMNHGRSSWSETRNAVSNLLAANNATLRDDDEKRASLLIPMSDVDMLLPADIGDYTDFYASINHATNIGKMFRPDNPLLPNYTHIPIGYHGRASSIVVSGNPIRRPYGQTRPNDDEPPVFGPCRLLDYELEMGMFVGPGNDLGTRIEMKDAPNHVFGMTILNDWSARDVQKWEYQPLGPFNAKNFASTISPWVVTLDALAPFLVEGPPREGDQPQPLDYLKPVDNMAIEMTVEAYISSKRMRDENMAPYLVSRGGFDDMYWTIAQMLVHHTSTGCNMRPGDLLGTGTISGKAEGTRGCLLETTMRGTKPITLPDGTERKLLQDGDEVIICAYCERNGNRRIGFGECRGVIQPAE